MTYADPSRRGVGSSLMPLTGNSPSTTIQPTRHLVVGLTTPTQRTGEFEGIINEVVSNPVSIVAMIKDGLGWNALDNT